jgi:predicted dehydrogenase
MAMRLGIIGSGSIGNVHARAAARNGVAVVGAWDANAASAEGLARAMAAAGQPTQASPSLADLLRRPDVDAVAIATPNFLHAEHAIAALLSGKHVLLEKPMAMDEAECLRIAEAAERSRRTVQVGFVCRGTPTVAAAKAFASAGRLGRVYHAKCSLYRRRGIPGLGGWFTTKAKSGGGPLIDLGVHVLDVVLHLVGHPKATRVSGSCTSTFGHPIAGYRFVDMWAGPPKPDGTFDVEDQATALIRFEGGLTVELNVSWAMNAPEGALKDGIVILGDRGGISLEVLGSNCTLATEEDGRIVDVKALVEPGDALDHAWDRQYRQFRDAVERGVAPHASAADAVALQRIVDGIYRSSAEGREIELSGAQPFASPS